VTSHGAPIPLIDPFARRVKDLRVSITDRCNFRCAYCMPEEGMQWLPRDELLTYEEIARVARVCVERFGFESVRVTGGEPLVRAHVTRLVQMLAALDVDIAMTTNGVKLPELAHELAAAGSSHSPNGMSCSGCSPESTLRSTRGCHP
jgi:cyclic pyranopterin phosphate synthase